MKSKSLLAVALTLVALAFLSACGDDDSDTSTSTGDVTATTSEPGGGDATPAPSDSTEPSDNAPAPSGDAVRSARVEIVEFAYDPDPVTIEEGGKVTWINRDAAPHTATADDGSFDTGTLAQGKLKSETFKQAGTFTYICTIHPGMNGVVEVVEAG